MVTGNWAKSVAAKAETFARHLSDVFKPFPRNVTQEQENVLLDNQESSNISSCSNQGLRSIKKSKVFSSIPNLKLNLIKKCAPVRLNYSKGTERTFRCCIQIHNIKNIKVSQTMQSC